MSSIRPYFPAIGLVLGAIVVVSAPKLVAVLLAGLLLSAAVGYTMIVRQLQKAHTSSWGSRSPQQEPSFRNVTTVFRSRVIRDLN